jgi:hypothetical protein
MITKLKKVCKRCVEDYKDLNMYKLNIILYFMDRLHRFKLSEPFFDEEFILDSEMGPYLESVKDAYGQYNLYNIPTFGANNIFDDDEVLTLNDRDEIANDDDDIKDTHEIVITSYYEQDGISHWSEADMSLDNQTEEDIYEFMKAAFEAIDTTGLIYFYETSKDPERNVDVFLSDKLAAYLDVKAKGFPEPDKSKPLPQVEEEHEDDEITEEEILERLNRARKPL